MPSDPCVQLFPDRPERKDLRADPRCLKLSREVNCPRLGEPGILREKAANRGAHDGKGPGRPHRNAVAVIAHGEDGGFGEDRVRDRPLEYERAAVRAVSNEVGLTVLDEMQHGHLVAHAEQARACLEGAFGRIEFTKALENGHGT